VSVTLLAASAVAIVVLIMEFDWGIVTGLVLSGGAIFYEVLLSALAIMAAVITVRAKSRLGAIISLGVVGWTVTLYFIAFSAPDLALTQLLIETLTVVLLVLAFFRIAPDKLPPAKRSRRIYRSVVAMAAGLFGFITVITVAVIQAGESISPYFERFSVPVGQGGNIVNVILVDFRGYDTMGEITVLAIAALGGAALLQAPRMAKLRAHFLKRLHKVSPGAPSGEAGAEAALSQAALAQAGSTGAAETTPSTKEARHG
jgi:multicomponent Na+:H+ antiporter subunit A